MFDILSGFTRTAGPHASGVQGAHSKRPVLLLGYTMQWCKVVLTLVSLSVCLCSLFATAQQRPYWERSGCHLVGYSTLVQIPGCHKTRVDMNACRGYCVTYTLLSTFNQIVSNNIRYSSRGTCCAIGDTHDVIVILACENNEQKSVTYKSAASCSCTLCTQEDASQLNNV